MKENTQIAASTSLIIGGAALLGGGLGSAIYAGVKTSSSLMLALGIVGATVSTAPISGGITVACTDWKWEKFRANWPNSQADRTDIAYGRCLKQREDSKEENFVFTHGQHLDWMVVNILTKELCKVKGTHVLRHPRFTPLPDYSIEAYKNLCRDLPTGDNELRGEVISVDAYLKNTTRMESALWFFRNPNITSASREIVKTILEYHFADGGKVRRLTNKIVKLSDYLTRMAPKDGNLYAISVPKEKFKEMGWIAHRQGRPCGCKNREPDVITRVANLQAGQMKRCPNPCFNNPRRTWNIPPQVRLLTSQLTKENGVKISLFSTLTKAQKNFIKTQVRKLLK